MDNTELLDKILKLQADNKIAFMTIDGLRYGPIEKFVEQPLEGQLYDLNRDRATLYSLANEGKNKRWVNDLAMVYFIEYLNECIEKQRQEIVNLNSEINLAYKEVDKLKQHIVEITTKNEPKETNNITTELNKQPEHTPINGSAKTTSIFHPVEGSITI